MKFYRLNTELLNLLVETEICYDFVTRPCGQKETWLNWPILSLYLKKKKVNDHFGFRKLNLVTNSSCATNQNIDG